MTVSTVHAATKPTYTISSTTTPVDKKMVKYSTYNKYTKQYYTLRSYLEKLEKTGGGTLVLKKGTYTITNTLYVPSNVTIQFNDGVKVVKGTNSGTKKFTASHSVFQFIRPSKASKKYVYGGYSGEKNIKFIGKGTVVMDSKYDRDTVFLIMGHNQNVTIDNIDFKNMNSGHFIEMDASKNVVIKNSSFVGSKPSDNNVKEAINIDTPDLTTNGWHQYWSKFDKTPNDTVTIKDNLFKGLDRSIGTHKYSEGKLHTNVIINHNVITDMRNDGIRVMNWKNPIITNNTITNIGVGTKETSKKRGILASGSINSTIIKNQFNNVYRTMQFIAWKNTGPGEQYKVIADSLSANNKSALKNNKFSNVTESFVRITTKYNDFSNAEKIQLEPKF